MAKTISFTMHGIPVSGGIAIGRAMLVSHALLEVAHFKIPKKAIPDELARFDAAIQTVEQDLQAVLNQLPADAPGELDSFVNTHLLILQDSTLSAVPKTIIQHEQCNAEWALKQQMEHIVEQFDKIEDEYLRERKHDVIQVVERVIKVLLGHPSQMYVQSSHKDELILIAHDLSPADTIQFKHQQFAAFVTDVGGATSHTAILARSLNIPSIVALQRARTLVRDGELIIVDGNQGVLIVSPDQATLAEYKLRQEQWQIAQQRLKRILSTKAVTLDGIDIHMLANIDVPEDALQAKSSGAIGVGLYRTEFLFMNRQHMPDEQEQFLAYKAVLEAMPDMPVTIRTLDLGADKTVHADSERTCTNPALGLRAIRLCLAEPHIFHAQLRALLRASSFGQLKILIPMLASISELKQTQALIERAKISLREEGIAFDEHVQIGGMIEIPAAAICADAFAKELDFLSIGTNDLIQYTLAIDRTDDAVAHIYNPVHPAILSLIEMTIRAGEKHGKPVSVCGEMAGDAKLTRLLLGLGLRQFSMHPANMLMVKHQILQTDLSQISTLTRKIMHNYDVEKADVLLSKLNH